MKSSFLVSVLYVFCCLGTSKAFDPPIGIPDPANYFGTFGEIDQAAPAGSSNWPSNDEAGHYYVDSAHPSATDSIQAGDLVDAEGRRYGYPDKPRVTVTSKAVAAGSRIEIHGDGGTREYGGTWDPKGVGTATAPIWFIGVDTPIFTGKLDMGASSGQAERSYMVFDGIKWANGAANTKTAKLDIRPRYANNSIHHIIFRNCTMHGRGDTGQGTGVSVGTATFDPRYTVSDIVFYNCDVGYYGDKNAPAEECGIYPVFNLTRFWVLDSDIHDCAEDGFGGSHGGGRTATDMYVGRCNIYDNLTDPMDIKQMGRVVLSECNIWGHYDTWPELTSGDLIPGKFYYFKDVGTSADFENVGAGPPPYDLYPGTGGVGRFTATGTTPTDWGGATVFWHSSSGETAGVNFHVGGSASGPSYWNNFPEDVSLLFCTIRDSRTALKATNVKDLRVVGNVFHNIRNDGGPWPTQYSTSSHAIEATSIKGNCWIVGNTIVNCDGGIRIGGEPQAYNALSTYYRGYYVAYGGKTWAVKDTAEPESGIVGVTPEEGDTWEEVRMQIHSNIIYNTEVGTNDIDIPIGYLTNSVDADYNIIYKPSGPEFVNYTLQPNDLTSDPLMVNPGALDFRLGVGSPAIGSGTAGPAETVYENYLNEFGVSIAFDKAGIARPVNGTWDIGAYEFGSPASGVAPSTATPNLRLLKEE